MTNQKHLTNEDLAEVYRSLTLSTLLVRLTVTNGTSRDAKLKSIYAMEHMTGCRQLSPADFLDYYVDDPFMKVALK